MDGINKILRTSLLFIILMVAAEAAGAVNVKDYVVLKNQYYPGGSAACASASFTDQALFRVFPDGSQSDKPFQVPERRFLKITDVEWNVFDSGELGTLNSGWTMNLRIALSPIIPYVPHVFQSAFVTIGSTEARTGTTEYLTTGFLVSPEAMICPQANQYKASTIKTVEIANLILRGHLVDSP